MVGATGFEPATSCSQSRCSTKLSYAPTQGGMCYSGFGEVANSFVREVTRALVISIADALGAYRFLLENRSRTTPSSVDNSQVEHPIPDRERGNYVI